MPVAIPLFFALDVVIIALVLALWFFAVFTLTRPIMTLLAKLLADIPAVGDYLSNAVLHLEDAIAGWVQGLIRDAYEAGARPFVEMMNTHANTHSGDAYSQRLLQHRVVSAVITVADAAHNRVNAPTQTYVTNGSTVNNTYVTNYIDNTTTVAEAYTGAAYTQLADWANGAIQQVYQDVIAVDGRVDASEQYTRDTFTTANEYAATLDAGDREATIAAAGSYTDAQVATANDYTTQVRDYATATATHTQEWAQGYVSEHEDALKADLTAVAAGAAAIATTVAAEFADFMRDCGGPMCEDGLPFIKSLSGLKNLLVTGLLVGFLVEAYTDPEGTADATVAVADVVEGPAKALYTAMFGG